MTNRLSHILTALALIALAILWRFVNTETFHLYNLELVTAVTLIAAVYLPRRYALIVPLATVMLSDAVMGNSSIWIFTWSAFALIGGAGLALKRFKGRTMPLIAGTTGLGLLGALWFFLWTNAGVWLQGYYPAGVDGLLASYQAGLPFLRATLVSGGVLAPLAMLIATASLAMRPAFARLVDRQHIKTA